ncbi:MAG: hypothetical protein LKI39_15290 [Bacteroides sp.]|jgi:hypothetical protein|nr:hypothetical protein [Bacteroides sp.]
MENIRETLRLLFLRQSCDTVLDSLNGAPDQRADVCVDEDWFRNAFREEINAYSLDQLSAVAQLLQSKWMKYDKEKSCMYQFYAQSSVFNVLLHFSAEVLHEMDNKPVCCYESLLRWNNISSWLGEDLFVTSFYASRDLVGKNHRHSFTWKAVIDHDNAALNTLFEKRMADVHFHLKGSSLNFELNWLCLMNDVSNRNKEFEKMKHFMEAQKVYGDKTNSSSFHSRVIKAAAIRYLLFQCIINEGGRKEEAYCIDKEINKIIRSPFPDEIQSFLPELSRKIDAAKLIYGRKYQKDLSVETVPDYANIIRISEEDGNNPMSFLGGERFLMYEVFRHIYDGKYVKSLLSTLFYAYLLIKAEFRKELVQLNERLGFANFAEYESRKELFIRKGSIYECALPVLALSDFFISENSNRYLEARITPKDTVSKLEDSIKHTDKDIRFMGYPRSLPSLYYYDGLDVGRQLVTRNWNYHYILHFIKCKDDTKQELFDLKARHSNLRKKIEDQAKAIYLLRKKSKANLDRVVGIDAANSEIFCRPEVFAQAFRYLGKEPVVRNDALSMRDLGLTFHVGEDFLDVTDGLRAIDEVLYFMDFSNGDRLGHALALGIDVDKYYDSRHNTVAMPKQVLLDNVVWLYIRGTGMKSMPMASAELVFLYERIFREVYKSIPSIPTIRDYYLSWLLRGDDPKCYVDWKSNISSDCWNVIPWYNYRLNDNKEAIVARQNETARSLYYAYHYDASAKQFGAICEQLKLKDAVVQLIKEVQHEMLFNVESRRICIETNPSSNVKIGGFGAYLNHPITKFFNLGLKLKYESHFISTSINTDDKGIFLTSLEREFSLLASSLEKEYKKGDHENPPRVIYEWLDKIREMAFEQRFYREP